VGRVTVAGIESRSVRRLASRLLLRAVRLLPEFALVLAFYAAYEWVRDAVHSQVSVAVERGLALLHDETVLHLDPEHALNNLVAGHPLVAQVFDYYYASGHFIVTIAVLILLYWRCSGIARRYASAFFAMNLLGLLGFWLFALAPPRLLPHREFVDTVVMFHTTMGWGSPTVQAASNQYAAMPSLHVGWAVWCTATVWAMTRRRWIRVLAAAYPVATTIVVLATANHYLADTVAGALCCASGFGVLAVGGRLRRGLTDWVRHRRGVPVPLPSPGAGVAAAGPAATTAGAAARTAPRTIELPDAAEPRAGPAAPPVPRRKDEPVLAWPSQGALSRPPR
jgi:hypothetical protein